MRDLKTITSLKVSAGKADEDPVKAVTPMIYYSKFEADDGVVITIGIGWWHWYANVRTAYLY